MTPRRPQDLLPFSAPAPREMLGGDGAPSTAPDDHDEEPMTEPRSTATPTSTTTADGAGPGVTARSRPAPTWIVAAAAVEGVGFAVLVGASGSGVGRVLRVLLVAAVTTVAVRSLRSAGRAAPAAAIACGVVGFPVGAAIAARHLTATGIGLQAVAGVAVLVPAITLLGWGTVRVATAMRGWRRLWLVPAALVLLQFVVQPLFAAAITTNAPRTPPPTETPADRGLAYEDVSFATADGVTISGWMLPGPNRAAVVLVPGSGSERSATLDQAEVLARHGYGALLIDPRGQGRSGGIGMDAGWYTAADIDAAVRFLGSRDDVDPRRIGVLGLSMGAEAALTAAAGNPAIRAVVAEGVGRRVAADHAEAGGLERVLLAEQDALTDLLTDAERPVPLRDAVAAVAPRRMLLIAGAGEQADAEHDRRGAPDAVELLSLDDTPHTQGLAVHPAEWESTVIAFLDRELAPEPPASP